MTQTTASSSPAKNQGIAIFVRLFMAFGAYGLFVGVTAAACRNTDHDGAKKLRYCMLSIKAGAVFPEAEHKSAILYLERGIAHAQLDSIQNALDDMSVALDKATRGQAPQVLQDATGANPRPASLIDRIAQEPLESTARSVWLAVLDGIRRRSGP